MTEGLQRYYGKNHLHFVTFSCYQRRPLLDSAEARNLFVQELARAREEYNFAIVGYVVMPDHVHLLFSEPAKGTPSSVLQMLKQRVSHKMRAGFGSSHPQKTRVGHANCLGTLRRFWQSRFYDFNVYSHEKKKEKLDYMHANPVTRGLVQHPKDWPWSSFRFYSTGEQGHIAIDAVNF
jgi:putative transposase